MNKLTIWQINGIFVKHKLIYYNSTKTCYLCQLVLVDLQNTEYQTDVHKVLCENHCVKNTFAGQMKMMNRKIKRRKPVFSSHIF